MKYDLVVIGSGPAGFSAATTAAKLGKNVAMIERKVSSLGGACLHTGTIPSKTMREAILHLTGYRQRDVYGEQYRHKRRITMEELHRKLDQVTRNELAVIEQQLDDTGVTVYTGHAEFVDPHAIMVHRQDGEIRLEADRFLLAPGSRPRRPEHIEFDGTRVFDSDQLLQLKTIPRSMVVVGGGVIGIEYGIMFAALGTKVTLIDGHERLLPFCDREVVDALLYHARTVGMTLRLGEAVARVAKTSSGPMVVELESRKRVVTDTVLFSVGRVSETDKLNLPAAGIETDSRGRISRIADSFQTDVPHIYASGDVVGFPALASTAILQGRQAVCQMFDQPCPHEGAIPYGLFTIPEISLVGKTEEELTAERIPYEVGHANFNMTARGQIIGDQVGMLKLLFHRETRKLLGVHCIGESATEIIHIGQAVIAFDGTIDYFVSTVFNYPTMAECYKLAAIDGLDRLCIDVESEEPEVCDSPESETAAEQPDAVEFAEEISEKVATAT